MGAGADVDHHVGPWRMADSTRRPRESARIEPEWITQYFRANGATDSDED